MKQNENYYIELASCLLFNNHSKIIQSKINISRVVLSKWEKIDIHSKELWKRIIAEYIKRIDIEKIKKIEEKYDIFLTKNINEKNISQIMRMPLKKVIELRKSKNFKKNIYDLLMRQDKDILKFHINMILYNLNYRGRI